MAKQKISLFLSLAITASMLAFMPAGKGYAAADDSTIRIDSVDVDNAAHLVTIKGAISSGSGREVTVRVTSPGGKTDYLNQTTSGTDGFFSFAYLPSEILDGAYQVKIGGESVGSPSGRDFDLEEAHSEAGATLTGDDAVAAGQPFDLMYGLSGVEGEVLAQDITVAFDADQLDFVSAQSLNEEAFTIADYKETEGKIRLLGVHLGEANPNAALLKLTFKAKADIPSGIANIAVTNLIAANSAGVETTLDGASHSVQINVIDKAALNALIAEAQNAHDAAVEGSGAGQYPAGSKAALQTALDSAKAVAGNSASTQEQIEQATAALNAALQAFRNSVNVAIPGDHNNDNRVSIGDLAIIAKAYGTTSADPDWDRVKSADLNHDGIIDIEDLAALARLIING